MSTSERLKKIIEANVPAKVVFKAESKSPSVVLLVAKTVENGRVDQVPEDLELQAALAPLIAEHWNYEKGRFEIDANIAHLWDVITNALLREYEKVSDRCAATKRKTEKFICGIKVDNKHLSNYLIQMFLRIKSNNYSVLSITERKDLFEQFESLRRTYGKRS